MQRSDTVLKQVMAAFERESHLKLHNHPIHMSFDGDALTVAGEVPDIASKKRLLQLTQLHSEATRLVDQLRVTANPPVGDGELRTHICERLAQAVDFRNCVICARIKGELELTLSANQEVRKVQIRLGPFNMEPKPGSLLVNGKIVAVSNTEHSGDSWWIRFTAPVTQHVGIFTVISSN